MATGAADGFFRPIYEGCISGYDHCVERRPYHRNCGCALHSKSKKLSTQKLPKCGNVSYPMRRAWSEGNLALAASSSSSHHSSPSTSPAPPIAFKHQKRASVDLDHLEEEEHNKISEFL